MLRALTALVALGLAAGAPVSPQTEKVVQPKVVPLQEPVADQAQAQAAPDPAVPATSPGPQVDWATGQPLPQAPVAEAPPVPAAVPAQAVPAAVPAQAVADTSPLPQMYEGDTRITNAADSNCVSIMAGTSDWWCATTCATRQDAASCPPTMCKCDAAAKADADAKAADVIAKHKEAEDAIKAAADAMAPEVSPAAVEPAVAVAPAAAAPAAVAPAAVAPAAAQEEPAPENLVSHQQAEEQVKAAADAVKAAADEMKNSMLPSPAPGAAPAKTCTAIIDTASDEWCTTTCATSYCPPTACKCDEPEEAVPKMRLDAVPATQGAQAVAAPAADASPAPDGPGVDWATGQPLPKAPTAVPEPAYQMPVDPAVPQVAETPATPATPAAPVAVPVPAVPSPVAAPVDDRIANAADSNCVSIMAGTSDWWCATTCASSGASASACPATMCKCGDDAKAEADAKAAAAIEAQKAAEDAVKAAASEMTGAPAAATSPAPVAVAPVAVSPAPVAQQQAQAAAPASEEDDKDEDDKDEPAGSPEPPASKTCTAIIDTASDEWCTTTCATSYCPPTACKCDE